MNIMKDKKMLVRVGLLLFEIGLILYSVYSFTVPRLRYAFSYADMDSPAGIVVAFPEDGYYIDSSMESGEYFVKTPGIGLNKGSYRVIFSYKVEESSAFYSLEADDATYRLLTGRQNVMMNHYREQDSIQFYLNDSVENFRVRLNFNGSGYVWIREIQVVQTWQMERMRLMLTFLFVLVVELFWWMLQSGVLKNISAQQKNVGLMLGVGVAMASLPCLTYYIQDGFDLNFHLMRIEGIAEGLKNGTFPVKMQLNWLEGNGYPVSVFYGDTLLYIPAFLRLVGFPLQSVYKFYIILLNVLTGITMYLAVKGITKEQWIAVVASFLYLVLPYRLSCIYIRAGVGEYTAMAFMPLVFWGIYRIFSDDVTDKGWKWVWLISTIGFSGMLQSHLLSCAAAGIFTILVCICLWKKVFEPDRFKMLATVVIATVIANLYFLVPFLDYMRGSYTINDVSDVSKIETQGAFLAQIFSLFPKGNNISLSVAEGLGVKNEMVFSLGIVAWGGIVLFLYWRSNYKESKAFSKSCNLLLVLSCIALWMSTNAFPWDSLRENFEPVAFLIESLQFPWRILSVASVFMIGLISLILAMIADNHRDQMRKISVLFLLTAFVSAAFMTSDLIYENNTEFIVDGSDLEASKLQGAEYVPSGVDTNDLIRTKGVVGELENLTGYEAGKGVYRVYVENFSEPVMISVPRLYYKGYQAVSVSEGIKLECFAGENGRVTMKVPSGFAEEIDVKFVSPWYWRAAEVFSTLSCLSVVLILILKWRKVSR